MHHRFVFPFDYHIEGFHFFFLFVKLFFVKQYIFFLKKLYFFHKDAYFFYFGNVYYYFFLVFFYGLPFFSVCLLFFPEGFKDSVFFGFRIGIFHLTEDLHFEHRELSFAYKRKKLGYSNIFFLDRLDILFYLQKRSKNLPVTMLIKENVFLAVFKLCKARISAGLIYQELFHLYFCNKIFFQLSFFNFVKRRLGYGDFPVFDKFSHLPVEESKKKGPDERTILVGAGHDHYLVVTQFFKIKILLAYSGAYCGNNSPDLFVAEYLIKTGFLNI